MLAKILSISYIIFFASSMIEFGFFIHEGKKKLIIYKDEDICNEIKSITTSEINDSYFADKNGCFIAEFDKKCKKIFITHSVKSILDAELSNLNKISSYDVFNNSKMNERLKNTYKIDEPKNLGLTMKLSNCYLNVSECKMDKTFKQAVKNLQELQNGNTIDSYDVYSGIKIFKNGELLVDKPNLKYKLQKEKLKQSNMKYRDLKPNTEKALDMYEKCGYNVKDKDYKNALNYIQNLKPNLESGEIKKIKAAEESRKKLKEEKKQRAKLLKRVINSLNKKKPPRKKVHKII